MDGHHEQSRCDIMPMFQSHALHLTTYEPPQVPLNNHFHGHLTPRRGALPLTCLTPIRLGRLVLGSLRLANTLGGSSLLNNNIGRDAVRRLVDKEHHRNGGEDSEPKANSTGVSYNTTNG